MAPDISVTMRLTCTYVFCENCPMFSYGIKTKTGYQWLNYLSQSEIHTRESQGRCYARGSTSGHRGHLSTVVVSTFHSCPYVHMLCKYHLEQARWNNKRHIMNTSRICCCSYRSRHLYHHACACVVCRKSEDYVTIVVFTHGHLLP